jgi:hypothetical protein
VAVVWPININGMKINIYLIEEDERENVINRPQCVKRKRNVSNTPVSTETECRFVKGDECK